MDNIDDYNTLGERRITWGRETTSAAARWPSNP